MRLSTTMRSGRMSCRVAREWSMTKMFSCFSSSMAGSRSGKFRGMVDRLVWLVLHIGCGDGGIVSALTVNPSVHSRQGQECTLDEGESALSISPGLRPGLGLRRRGVGLEQMLGVQAAGYQRLNLFYHGRPVFGVGDAEPLARGVQHLHGGGAVLDELVHHERDEEFALQVLHVPRVAEEGAEVLFAVAEVVRRESPEVHAHGCSLGRGHPLAVVVQVLHLAVHALYLGALHHRGQHAPLVGAADAARDGPAFAQRIAHAEAYHSISARAALGQGGEEAPHHLERVAPVEVVAIDYRKRLVDDAGAHQYGVVRAPRLGAPLRAGEALGQGVERLEHQLAGDVPLVLGDDFLAEVPLEVLADDKHQLAEAGVDGVVDGVVHDGLAVRTQSVQLLQSAVAASHAGGEEEKSRFHDDSLLRVVHLPAKVTNNHHIPGINPQGNTALERIADGEVYGRAVLEAGDVVIAAPPGVVGVVQGDAPVQAEHQEVHVVTDAHPGAQGYLAGKVP